MLTAGTALVGGAAMQAWYNSSAGRDWMLGGAMPSARFDAYANAIRKIKGPVGKTAHVLERGKQRNVEYINRRSNRQRRSNAPARRFDRNPFQQPVE